MKDPRKVQVKLGEPLWRQAGNREISLEWEGGTLLELLEELVARYPSLAGELGGKSLLTGGGGEEVPYTIFVNGELVPPQRRPEKRVPGGAEVVILLPLAGG